MVDILYGNQTSVDFTITTGVNITGATCVLKYRSPDGNTTGSLAGTISIASTGVFTAALTADILGTNYGPWAFWAYVTFSDGRVAAGKPFYIEVRKEGY